MKNAILAYFLPHAFLPQGHCYRWEPHLIWLHVSADAFITIAYYIVVVAIIYFLQGRKDLSPQTSKLILGNLCIFATCGTRHLVEVISVWLPVYWFSGILKVLSAGLSLYVFIFLLVPLIPLAFEIANYANLKATNLALMQKIKERRTIEAQLREVQERFNIAIKGSRDGIWDWNILTNEVYYSPRFKAILGYEDHELENQFSTFESRLHPEDRDRTLQALTEHIKNRVSYDVDYRLRTKIGNYLWISARGEALRNEAGEAIRMAGSMRDITKSKDAEIALKASQARLSGILDIAQDAIISVDDQQKIQLFNRGAEGIFGYQAHEVLGQSLDILLPESVRATHRSHVDSFAKSGITSRPMGKRPEVFARHRDGTKFPAEASISQLNLPEGRIFTVILRDITERRWIESQLRSLTEELEARVKQRTNELSAIIDNLGDGLLVTDSTGAITRYNPALLSMFPLDNIGLKGKKFGEVLSSQMAELLAQHQVNPNQVVTAEVELAQERIGHALVTGIMQKKNAASKTEYMGSVVLIRDITAEKEIDRMKTDFISTVSHELRTPLTSVLGFAKLIQKKWERVILPEINVEKKRTQKAVHQVGNNLNIIVSEGERLTSLISDILDIAKIEAGKLEWQMENIAIATIIEQAIAATSVLFQTKKIELIRDIPTDLPEVIGDRDRLIQVVINLLSNAIKFTDTGSITCRAQRFGNELVVSIIDTGIGLAPEDKAKVFEKFKQVGDTLTDKPKGTGLGLPICQQIIKHHGGQIWVESELNQGSNFSFTLPVSSDVLKELEKTAYNSLVKQLKDNLARTVTWENKSGKNILVVDDDAHIRSLLRQELEAQSYSVREAKDGMEALSQVKSQPPDLIILDVMMPSLSGFDVAAILRNDPETMDIPMIILSIIEDRQRGYRLGIDRYLTKPINTKSLLQEIKVLLSQKNSHKKVLVVDQDLSALKNITDILLTHGYVATEANNGSEGIEKALAIKPDMIIVDEALSQEHNFVQTLRFDNELENVFVILVEKAKVK